jgi:manganese-dependent inorganic pyrophosphatase
MPTTIVTSYTNPDLDGVACTYAYTELLAQQGQSATIYLSGLPHIEARFVLHYLALQIPTPSLQLNEVECILVDASSPNALPIELRTDQVVEIIDHRSAESLASFERATAQVELVGAAATLITERFRVNNCLPSQSSATLLYTAIVSNTLNFKAFVTTTRDHTAAAWLQSLYPIAPDLVPQMFEVKSDLAGPKLEEALSNETARLTLKGRTVLMVQTEMVGVEALLATRFSELISYFESIVKNSDPSLAFMTFLDLEKGTTTFISTHSPSITILGELLQITFQNNRAERPGLLLRKEIIPQVLAFWQ